MDESIYKQAKNALKVSNERLHEFMDALPHMVWTGNSSGKILFFNKAWYAYTGMKPGQTEGWVNVVHPEDSPQVIAAWNQALLTGQYQIEHRIRNYKDGSYKWFLEQAAPILDEAGNTILWFGTFTDLSSLK